MLNLITARQCLAHEDNIRDRCWGAMVECASADFPNLAKSW